MQIVGHRPQRPVALVSVEAEHHEARLRIEPEPACAGSDLGHQRVAWWPGVEADEVVSQRWVASLQSLRLLSQGRAVAGDLRKDGRGDLRTGLGLAASLARG